MVRVLGRLEPKCDSDFLRGISSKNEYQVSVTVNMDGYALNAICRTMGKELRPLYSRGADLLKKRFTGHRSNGDSVVEVSSIHTDDMDVYPTLVKERIMRAQKVGNNRFPITAEVDDAEETLMRSLHKLSRRFDVSEVTVENDQWEILVLNDSSEEGRLGWISVRTPNRTPG